MPWADAGIVVIMVTIIVRLILFPFSRKATITQARMAEISPDLEKIKEKYKDKPEEQARMTMALYQEKGVNPFSGILVLFIQLPIIIALYRIFILLPAVNSDYLYSFITAPGKISTTFLGLVDLSGKSVIIALLAAASTYLQASITSRNQKPPQGNSFGDNLSRSMQSQMKYFFPVMVFFISYKISGVIALYWLTTNLFSAAQEYFVRRNLNKPALLV